MNTIEKVNSLLRHIHHVQENCVYLGLKLIELGEEEFGKTLIANGQIHDNSKWKGVEWDHLESKDPLLKEAILQHSRTNSHHPEYWGGIHIMPSIYIAEMVCDWKARSTEFGTDVRVWITARATERFGFTMGDRVGLVIEKYIDLLLDKEF